MISNIIIVDDETSALKLLNDILTAEGHRVRPFDNGELALRSAEAETPNLILLDIRMPGMNGFEVCRQLKVKPHLAEIPVIFISAAADLDDKVHAFQAGGVDYITKPFQKEEVIARVKTHVMLNQSLLEMTRIAEALRKSEASLKMAQTIAHLGHWEWHAATGDFNWSEETYRIFGLDPQSCQPTYQTFLQAIHPEDRERASNCLAQLADKEYCDVEYRVMLAKGEVRVVQSKGQVVRFGANQETKVFGTVQTVPQQPDTTTMGIIQDITERKQLEWQLEQQANTDYLTGCASRRYFLEHAEQEMLRVQRYGGKVSMLMLDLDHFKTINDRYGHHAGDLTLQKLVAVCHHHLRSVDLFGRLGGEEFAIMLPETDCVRAREVAQRLCVSIAAAEVLLQEETSLRFTTSIGVACVSNNDMHIDTVLNRADQALYKAKREGRNRVCVESSAKSTCDMD